MTVRAESAATPSGGTGEALVQLTGVQKYFGELHVLRDIELEVSRGEVVVVIGPSGSGFIVSPLPISSRVVDSRGSS